ncbi:aldehyde dehydrogenase family protein [Amycolatopsis sp. 3B14]|uniref:aldehyde dehydrogenase family protein n=1 Tax=Amycolatopsis sp. 3B14 TaxID=3243600 RepID=UPI003D973277
MTNEVTAAVEECARAAWRAQASLSGAGSDQIDSAIEGMARLLIRETASLLDANRTDLNAARQRGMSPGLIDRLSLTEDRLSGMAHQLTLLAQAPHPVRVIPVATLRNGGEVVEFRRPVGVIGANYEARPTVTVDVASQLVKSRNAGVLRTGSAALRTAQRLHQLVIAPALADVDIDPAVVQLVPRAEQEAATALVRLPAVVPLVILRGSGASTRALATEAAMHGVRTLAHADGGAVLYIDVDADAQRAQALIAESLDRLGVCNRLNLLLIHPAIQDALWPALEATLAGAGIRASLPPHAHALGHEWALDPGREATVTVAPADGPEHAAEIANEQTSGLAAAIVTENEAAAQKFFSAYTGAGVFWNASTRLLDGFKLLATPETGINLDRVPGPRGPVTYTDLYIRQYGVTPLRTPDGATWDCAPAFAESTQSTGPAERVRDDVRHGGF